MEFHPPELTSLGASSTFQQGQPRPSWAPVPRAASLGLSHQTPRKGLPGAPPSLKALRTAAGFPLHSKISDSLPCQVQYCGGSERQGL